MSEKKSYEEYFASQNKIGKLRELQSLRYYQEVAKKINSFLTPPPQQTVSPPKGFGSDKEKDGPSDKFVKYIAKRVMSDKRLKNFKP